VSSFHNPTFQLSNLILLGNRGLFDLLFRKSFHDKSITSIVLIINHYLLKGKMYCVKCKVKTDTKNRTNFVNKNGRPMFKGECAVCGIIKTHFLKGEKQEGDLVGSLNSLTGNIKLPWAKYPGEMHLPGHSFTGPGTRLDMRVNPDGSYRPWSNPVNRVDNAAYHHDLAYAQYKDTANRNVADREMITELNNINNPSVRERIERAIVNLVKPILSTKAHFGLGVPNRSDSKKLKNLMKKVSRVIEGAVVDRSAG